MQAHAFEHRLRQGVPDTIHTPCGSYLRAHSQTDPRGKISHTLFTNGTFYVTNAETLRAKLAESFRAGTMPAIQEVHTVKFPMYLDVDLQCPMQHLSEGFYERIAVIMNTQICKFYRGGRLVPRCLVCTKSLGGTARDDGAFKHGIHLHWPELIVTVEQALSIRLGVLRGLAFVDDWTSELGLATPDWEVAVDENVYRRDNSHERHGGLRLVGAPKAKACRCPHRSTGGACDACERKNNNHVLDLNVYVLTHVITGDTPDAAHLAYLKANFARVLSHTTVRCEDNVALTPGFELYEPSLRPPPPRERKRPRAGASSSSAVGEGKIDKRKLGRKFEEIHDPAVAQCLRKILVRHSDKYADSRMKILFDGTHRYKVLLSGDGAHWCLNKGDFHSGQNVYMDVFKAASGFEFRSVMKCWSTKAVVYPRSMCTCADFESKPLPVWADEVRHLFTRQAEQLTAKDVDNPRARMQALHAQNRELMRAIGNVGGQR